MTAQRVEVNKNGESIPVVILARVFGAPYQFRLGFNFEPSNEDIRKAVTEYFKEKQVPPAKNEDKKAQFGYIFDESITLTGKIVPIPPPRPKIDHYNHR